MKEVIANFLSKYLSIDKNKILGLLEVPPDSSLGDYALPCFILAKDKKQSPVDIATSLSLELGKKLPKEISGMKADGPYLNFFLDKKIFVENTINQVLKEKEKYGKGNEKSNVMIEFSQANTHKAFHVGHIRGTSLGESLARILEFYGNKVIRVNYQGDTGMHVAKWIWCYQKHHKKEKLSNDESWIASIYVDAVKRLAEKPELQDEVNVINQRLEEGKDKKLTELWKKTRKASLTAFEKIYKDLNTKFNHYFFESDIEKKGKEISKELVKNGIAKIDDGATIIDMKDQGLGVFILLRKDGTVLYSAKDLALAEEKFKRFKINKSITVLGVAQKLHSLQVKKTLEIMKFPNAKNYSFEYFNEVRLPTGKMSSRTGENILYSDFKREIIDYAKTEIKKREPKISAKELEKRALLISIAAIKYSMLKQDNNKNITFDKEEALNFEGNSGPYLQYSYARANSILKKSKKQASNVKVKALEEREISLVKKLEVFPEVVNNAYKALNPCILANYVFELSQIFNEFYQFCKVIGTEEESQRIGIIKAFMYIQKSVLSLLGIEIMEKM